MISLPRIYLLLTIGYLGFIAAASFYLTRGLSASDLALENLFWLRPSTLRFSFHNLRDVSTNVLLYLPLGLLVCLTISTRRQRAKILSPTVLLGFAISVVVETIQAFIGRTSDPVDVISNGVGFSLGYGVAWWTVYRIGLEPAALLGLGNTTQHRRRTTLLGLRFGYIVVAVTVSLLPLNISVSLADLIGQLNSVGSTGIPRLILDPLFHIRNDGQSLHWLILRSLVVVPFAILSTLLCAQSGSTRLLTVARQCLLFSAALEVSKIFIMSAYSDVLVVLLAPVIGTGIAAVIRSPAPGASHAANLTSWTSLGMIAYAIFLLLMAWSPYDFELTSRLVQSKLMDSNLIPFRLHFSTRSISSAVDIVKESGLYIPLGALLAVWLKQKLRHPVALQALLAAAIALSFATVAELTQVIVVGRYVDITDPLLAALGAVVGFLLAPLLNDLLNSHSH